MCGRYTLNYHTFSIADELGIERGAPLGPSLNIAPSETIAVIHKNGENSHFLTARWGYRPNWGKGAQLVINLKSETISSKQFASAALKEGRCIVPTTGFYEWKQVSSTQKLPILFRVSDAPFFGLAALLFPSADGLECVMLTTEANDAVREIHSRMPVILSRSDWNKWLESDSPADTLMTIGRPFPRDRMESIPADPRINSARFKGDQAESA